MARSPRLHAHPTEGHPCARRKAFAGMFLAAPFTTTSQVPDSGRAGRSTARGTQRGNEDEPSTATSRDTDLTKVTGARS